MHTPCHLKVSPKLLLLLSSPPNSEYIPDKCMGAAFSGRTHHFTDYCYSSWTTTELF
jgi:prenyltransferase beta subunit